MRKKRILLVGLVLMVPVFGQKKLEDMAAATWPKISAENSVDQIKSAVATFPYTLQELQDAATNEITTRAEWIGKRGKAFFAALNKLNEESVRFNRVLQDATSAAATKAIRGSQSENDKIKNEFAKLEKEAEVLATRLANATELLAEKPEMTHLQIINKEYADQLDKMKKKYQEVEQKLTEQQKQIDVLTQQAQELPLAISVDAKSADDALAKAAELQQKITTIETEKKQVIELARQEIESMQKNKEAELAKLNAALEESVKKSKQESTNLASIETEKKQKDDAIAKLTTELTTTKQQTEQQAKDNATLKTSLAAAEEKVKQLEEAKTKADVDLNAAVKKYEQAEKELAKGAISAPEAQIDSELKKKLLKIIVYADNNKAIEAAKGVDASSAGVLDELNEQFKKDKKEKSGWVTKWDRWADFPKPATLLMVQEDDTDDDDTELAPA